jgi:hypothetical protein
MSQFDELIAKAENVGLKERKQFVQYFLNAVTQQSKRLSDKDRKAVLEFAYRQIDVYLAAIPEADCYKDKDDIFEQEDMILGIIMTLCPAPGSVPPEKLMKIQTLVKMVEDARKIEMTLDNIFAKDSIQESDINSLLFWVKQTNDEYQRAVIYAGLLHYRDRIRLFTEGAKNKLSQHLHSEMRRILDMDPISGDALNALEMLADVCKLFPGEDTAPLLMNLLCLKQNQISFFAVESLLFLGQEVPGWAVNELAQDLIRANLVYIALEQYGKTALFPTELNNEVYLAKSDLVHWLTYPTELGKVPDEIEYIGKIKYLFKKDVYHVFKFRSDSETLGEDLTGKWLIGWSSKDGGTFSNFDEFEKFDLGDTDKTLKNIKKKLIG